MSFKAIGMFVGLFLLVGVFASSFVAAGSAVIKTIPVQKIWNADGVTEYQVNVYADNTGLNGAATQGIQWTVVAPQSLAPYLTITRAVSAKESPLLDFFHGNTMWDMITTDWSSQGRAIMAPVSSSQGLVASYWFTLAPGAPLGKTSFDLGDVKFTDIDGEPQALAPTQNNQFIVSNLVKRTAIPINTGAAEKVCPANHTC